MAADVLLLYCWCTADVLPDDIEALRAAALQELSQGAQDAAYNAGTK